MTAGRLHGERALIARAASDIGREAALRLARNGAAVGTVDRAGDRAEAIAAQIRER